MKDKYAVDDVGVLDVHDPGVLRGALAEACARVWDAT
ncbi:hypothetical protein J2Y00_004706 [Deinococcus soli (ex Cha et al. 2016)]|uniref:Uncharacterized protein n=2 Tax=Deinococcus soli (ex Cha et al. 2016) TaxID=1309411 RepID=A0AAE4BPI4_9DEIO|nr:hypothetical protein [Deinococcus soli (ex Cha et al. 2016)]MDR6330984.1 hypothetical protein [Deinococcus soli (ex Cha et al. 2016)]MDR6754180.1 hypothetical protein [Deinococcus soli (ex Cha et al. 2016)]